MNYIGIDPGKDGAFVVLSAHREIVKIALMPTIGKEYDKPEMIKVVQQYDIRHAVLENVHAPQLGGRTSCFEFGRGKGLLEMLLFALEIPHTQVLSRTWQKEMWSGIKIQYKTLTPRKVVDTKSTSLLAAKSLFPSQDLRKSTRASNPHDGIVDALLMAEYCRRKFQ